MSGCGRGVVQGGFNRMTGDMLLINTYLSKCNCINLALNIKNKIMAE